MILVPVFLIVLVNRGEGYHKIGIILLNHKSLRSFYLRRGFFVEENSYILSGWLAIQGDDLSRGQKIGVQWRFTEEEIRQLFSRQRPGQDSPTQIVRSFLGQHEREGASFLALLDFPCVTEKDGMEMFAKLQKLRGAGIASMSYEYHDEGQLLRIALDGDTGAVMDLLEQIREEK